MLFPSCIIKTQLISLAIIINIKPPQLHSFLYSRLIMSSKKDSGFYQSVMFRVIFRFIQLHLLLNDILIVKYLKNEDIAFFKHFNKRLHLLGSSRMHYITTIKILTFSVNVILASVHILILYFPTNLCAKS